MRQDSSVAKLQKTVERLVAQKDDAPEGEAPEGAQKGEARKGDVEAIFSFMEAFKT